MRLIDADALIDRAYRERLDSRELIAQMIESAPTVAVEEDYVALKKDLDYWYELAKFYVNTILKRSVDTELVKHGHWIGVEEIGFDDGKPVYVVYKCSICGEKHKGEEYTLTDYCPCCGAKMDKKEEETEVWNCSNGRKIVAPKGTFDKIYYGEIKDEYEDE